jgi:folate-binding protein YgfZ
MDATHLVSETGIEAEAIRYDKGCYIGQEVIARIRTYGRVTKRLRGFRLEGDWPVLPAAGAKIYDPAQGKEAGYLTSVIHSPRLGGGLALGYVRREFDGTGNVFRVGMEGGAGRARLVELPVPG